MLYVQTREGTASTPEVESGPTENWYRGKTFSTSAGVYFLRVINRDIQWASFDFYPNGSGSEYSTLSMFFHDQFYLGDQLYYFRYAESDYIIVELVEEEKTT